MSDLEIVCGIANGVLFGASLARFNDGLPVRAMTVATGGQLIADMLLGSVNGRYIRRDMPRTPRA